MNASARLIDLAGALSHAAPADRIAEGHADSLIRAHLALLALPSSHLLDALEAATSTADPTALLVLVRVARCAALDAVWAHRYVDIRALGPPAVIRRILMPLLQRDLPTIAGAVCDAIATLAASPSSLHILEELRDAMMASLQIAASSSVTASDHLAIPSAALAATLAIAMQRASPSHAFGASLIDLGGRLQLAGCARVRSAALVMLSTELESLALREGRAGSHGAGGEGGKGSGDGDVGRGGSMAGGKDGGSGGLSLAAASDLVWSYLSFGCALT